MDDTPKNNPAMIARISGLALQEITGYRCLMSGDRCQETEEVTGGFAAAGSAD
ncbi:MAG: hypothetical protein LBI62_10245 [Candidatus Accumulibacter sp.]|nr:hypothetical protein [Accumulibacter sp.]